jgi:FMN-dependent NADH-azoreductase
LHTLCRKARKFGCRSTAGSGGVGALRLVEEFLGASAYLFAVPMYNYSMPSVFKAWLDHIMIPGRTFGMADAPAAGRPAVLVSARGGGYGPGSPQHGKDFVVPALETILGDALGHG